MGVGAIAALLAVGWVTLRASTPAPVVPALPATRSSVDPPPERPVPDRTPPAPAPTDLDREVIQHHPPLDDPGAWQQERARVALALQERQVAATRAFAAWHHLDEPVTDELVAAIEALHGELRALKQQVETGEREPADLRAATPVLRSRCEDRVRAAIGPLTDELALHLADGEPGGGF